MIDNPMSHAMLIQIQQKLQGLDAFIQQWDARKVSEVAQKRLEELQKLEKTYQELEFKQQLITEEVATKTKEREALFFKERETWNAERKQVESYLRTVLMDLVMHRESLVHDRGLLINDTHILKWWVIVVGVLEIVATAFHLFWK